MWNRKSLHPRVPAAFVWINVVLTLEWLQVFQKWWHKLIMDNYPSFPFAHCLSPYVVLFTDCLKPDWFLKLNSWNFLHYSRNPIIFPHHALWLHYFFGISEADRKKNNQISKTACVCERANVLRAFEYSVLPFAYSSTVSTIGGPLHLPPHPPPTPPALHCVGGLGLWGRCTVQTMWEIVPGTVVVWFICSQMPV